MTDSVNVGVALAMTIEDIGRILESLTNSGACALVLVVPGMDPQKLQEVLTPLLLGEKLTKTDLDPNPNPDLGVAHYEQFRTNLGLQNNQQTKKLYHRLAGIYLEDMRRGVLLHLPQGMGHQAGLWGCLRRLGEEEACYYGKEDVETLAGVCRYTIADIASKYPVHGEAKARAFALYLRDQFGIRMPNKR